MKEGTLWRIAVLIYLVVAGFALASILFGATLVVKIAWGLF